MSESLNFSLQNIKSVIQRLKNNNSLQNNRDESYFESKRKEIFSSINQSVGQGNSFLANKRRLIQIERTCLDLEYMNLSVENRSSIRTELLQLKSKLENIISED